MKASQTPHEVTPGWLREDSPVAEAARRGQAARQSDVDYVDANEPHRINVSARVPSKYTPHSRTIEH